MGRLPYKVTEDPMVTPIREFAYLPEKVLSGHDAPPNAARAGQRPEEIVAAAPPKQEQQETEAQVNLAEGIRFVCTILLSVTMIWCGFRGCSV